jgi:hypothetical protein
VKALVTVALVVLLAACTSGYWPSQADQWRGRNLNDFIREHGAPQTAQRMNEMGEYLYVWNATATGDVSRADCRTEAGGKLVCLGTRKWQRSCSYTLVTDPRNIIRQAFSDGDCSWSE